MERKTKKIIFRVNEKLFDFINDISKEMGIERSELIRRIILHYFMAYFTGKFNNSYEELKKEFLSKISTS